MYLIPGFSCRWEAHAYLFDRGCCLTTHRLYIGPDGLWRGSGLEVLRG